MKVGVNLLLWTGNPTAEHARMLAGLKDMGCDGVEVPIFHYKETVYATMRQELNRLEMGATGCTVMPENANPISEDPAEREAGLLHLQRALQMCAILGADVLCGPMYSPVGRLVGRPPTIDECKRAVEVVAKAAETAAELKVDMAVEPLNRFETYLLNTVWQAVEFAKAVGHPRVSAMADSFHMNIEEGDIAMAVMGARGMISHVHISANHRGVPGDDHFPWQEFFRALKSIRYDRWLVIESFSQVVPEIAKAASIWRSVSSSQEDVVKHGVKYVRQMWEHV